MKPATTIFDDMTGRWIAATDGTRGAGGSAVATIGDAIEVEVDAVSGSLLSIVIEAVDGSGRLDLDTADLLAAICTGDLRSGDLDLRPGVRDDIVRLALFEVAEPITSFGGRPSPWWDEERDELLRRIERGPASTIASPSSASGPRPHDDAAARLTAIERVRERARPLGRLPEHVDRAFPVDPTLAPAGTVDLSGGCRLRGSDDPRALIVAAAPEQVYTRDLARLVAVVLDDESTPIAIAPFRIASSPDGSVEAQAFLVVNPERNRARLRVLVQSARSAPPTASSIATRTRQHFAALASAAARLGDDRLARTIWDQTIAGTEWHDDPPPRALTTPYLGELDVGPAISGAEKQRP